ncbi:MAG TPA: integrase family protein, partial [Steroidobacteraceae bacterium]
MQRSKLTNSAIEKFVCREGREQDALYCGELRGFGVKLSRRSGTKTFFLLGRVKGSKRERYISIGRFNAPYRVDQARTIALKLKAQMEEGTDPVEQREQKEAERQERAKLTDAQSATLQQMLDHYLEHKRTKRKKPLRPATKTDMRRSIETNLKAWLSLPVANLTRDMCYARFMELSKTAPVASNLTMVYLRSILNMAAEKYADEQGNFTILTTNPAARALKQAGGLNKEGASTRRIELARVGHVWLALKRLRAATNRTQDRTRVDLVCLRMLTAIRKSESGSLRWSQIDLDKKVIHLSGDVGKTHQDVALPMSDVLHAILSERAALPRKGPNAREYVFPAPKANAKTPWMGNPTGAMEVVSKAAGQTISSHDFRRGLIEISKKVGTDASDRRRLLVHAASGVHDVNYDNNPDPELLR